MAGFLTLEDSLLIACRSNRRDLVQYYLEQGADINTRGLDQNTPLLIACLNKNFYLARLLLAYGADPRLNHPDRLESPLSIAVTTSQFQLATHLLRHGAAFNDTLSVIRVDFFTPEQIAILETAGQTEKSFYEACLAGNSELAKAILTKAPYALFLQNYLDNSFSGIAQTYFSEDQIKVFQEITCSKQEESINLFNQTCANSDLSALSLCLDQLPDTCFLQSASPLIEIKLISLLQQPTYSLPVIFELVSWASNLNFKSPDNGATLFHLAAGQADLILIQHLLANFDSARLLDATDGQDRTAHMYAARAKDKTKAFQVLSFLIAQQPRRLLQLRDDTHTSLMGYLRDSGLSNVLDLLQMRAESPSPLHDSDDLRMLFVDIDTGSLGRFIQPRESVYTDTYATEPDKSLHQIFLTLQSISLNKSRTDRELRLLLRNTSRDIQAINTLLTENKDKDKDKVNLNAFLDHPAIQPLIFEFCETISHLFAIRHDPTDSTTVFSLFPFTQLGRELLSVLKTLFSLGKINPNITDRQGTPLFLFCLETYCIRYIKLNLLPHHDTPKTDLLSACLDHGADPNQYNPLGITPLEYVLRNTNHHLHTETVLQLTRLLFSKFAYPDTGLSTAELYISRFHSPGSLQQLKAQISHAESALTPSLALDRIHWREQRFITQRTARLTQKALSTYLFAIHEDTESLINGLALISTLIRSGASPRITKPDGWNRTINLTHHLCRAYEGNMRQENLANKLMIQTFFLDVLSTAAAHGFYLSFEDQVKLRTNDPRKLAPSPTLSTPEMTASCLIDDIENNTRFHARSFYLGAIVFGKNAIARREALRNQAISKPTVETADETTDLTTRETKRARLPESSAAAASSAGIIPESQGSDVATLLLDSRLTRSGYPHHVSSHWAGMVTYFLDDTLGEQPPFTEDFTADLDL